MKNRISLVVMLTLMMSVLLAGPSPAEEATVVGRVVDTQNIITEEGVIYEVALTDLGDELLLDHDGDLVEIIGTIEESDGLKIITVISYNVVEE
ncbi:MAG: hypothetical protein JEZ11_19825 [Desulfobacterales bacterium]|nr:hypothetical protein [Desulfobacterales bacterium]